MVEIEGPDKLKEMMEEVIDEINMHYRPSSVLK
jgi:hypothetical protein